MSIKDISFINEFIKVTSDSWRNGWHERNGGNISYRLTDKDIKDITPFINESREYEIGTTLSNLSNEYFFVSGSGKFFRNIELNLEQNCGLIKINETGDRYVILWGLINNAKPTSELPSHLMNHSVKKVTTNNKYRVVMHAHTPNVIALTFVLPLTSTAFTRELWEMATECAVVFPSGVGVVKWMVPGGVEIGDATSELMKLYDVAIWAHHGIFCTGESLDLTYGLLDTVEKAAEIAVKVRSMGGKKQTIESDDFKKLATGFGVELDKKFIG